MTQVDFQVINQKDREIKQFYDNLTKNDILIFINKEEIMNNSFTFDDIAQSLKITKSFYDLQEDIDFYNDNISALQSSDFELIKNRLEQSLNRYGAKISQLSCFTNVEVKFYPVLSYEMAFSSLSYITNNIPIYVAFDRLKERGIELLLNKLLQRK